ncbi:aspartyl/glutamyl-tRNA amidotransferase subunit B [Williamsoniiplasma luminosum]|uniref:Aspartyl/glutamyl-tRNA(Asn/Gln) amidotransferase subunit B n=1 Tax=Williamsoniiplasma luminosum TaxID=214888 RepID=A0A2K8NVJ0_9MOLU|nr:Asp-tRNA(Asn)/Glu-tRNA(Gln) amidotransferase subunit GatB [Williamsoniiplasma luminosum]ATZ16761.1 aspartyl/glutamyl-tRNA amidotransferase subunit B [Williamsoniiplasma luminosum]
MINNFEIIIGIENHVELKTNSKMFSSAQVGFGATPNTMINEVDLGYPGAMPTVNKRGIELAILAVNALKMKLDPLVKFDRKNYFYPDLVKGFQITQQYCPIGSEGILEIEVHGIKKNIEIERLHIEEDTAKQIHKGDLTFIDYNRSGIGLVEIVTKPVIRSADEAMEYVNNLREILLFLGISDVKMYEGSLRCDVNISLRPFGTTTFSNKVEIKNLNSIANIKKAIEFEVERQQEILLKNGIVEQETRRFDETTQQTVQMRAKAGAIDYKYFTEPNIAPIQLDQKWIDQVIANSPELPSVKRKKFVEQLGLEVHDMNIILSSLELTNFFEATIKLTNDANKVVKFLITDILSELNKNNLTIDQIKLTPKNLASLVNHLNDGIISSKHVKTIFPIIMNEDIKTVDQIIEENNLKLISDPIIIQDLLEPILQANQELLKQFNERPERVLKTIMGLLMKETQGNVHPDIANDILLKHLKN